jgi:hypothetical protein
MLLCLCEIVYALPITLAVQIKQLSYYEGDFLPYTSWQDVHSGFSAVVLIPSYMTTGSEFALIDLARWVGPISAFICFGYVYQAAAARRDGDIYTRRRCIDC